jgi:energy-coupling factor transport system ATP-binding protein
MTDVPVISLRDVSFTYRHAAVPALRDVTLEIARGQFVVLMGATGAGKSTLARCLNCSVPQFHPGTLSGSITVLGRSLAGATVSDLAGQVGLVSQDFDAQLFATNVRQEVAFGMEQLGIERSEMQRRLGEALALVGLGGFERRDPSTLSGGEKQRLAIAALLALEPAILVCDEPTTDLDPLGKESIFAVLATLRQRGSTILLIEHETEAASHADRLVLMAEGRIVADGAPAALLRDVDRLVGLGVRPLDPDRIGVALGWPDRVDDVDEAAARLAPLIARRDACPAPAQERDDSRDTTVPLLTAEGVELTYPTGQPALAGVSLTIRSGEFVALIGQNGSGKTTLAKCLNGLLHPQRGTVRLRGVDLAGLRLDRVAADVGYVFQNPDHQIFADSVAEEVAFALRNFGVAPDVIAARTHAALVAVGLAGCENADPFLLGKGQRQRLAVASFLALEPAVLMLDEPTTGLDYPEQRRMMDLLAHLHERGMTLVIITHTPWVVAHYAQRGVLMQAGRIVFDGPLRQLFTDEALLERCHFRVPDVTRVGHRLGFTPLTVAELLATVDREPQAP